MPNMVENEDDLDPVWDDIDRYFKSYITMRCWLDANADNRAMGQLFMMGWEGTEVTPQIRSLIEDHYLGSIILTTKNLKCKSDVHL
jgi:beta-N-acetylhexosaminidase